MNTKHTFITVVTCLFAFTCILQTVFAQEATGGGTEQTRWYESRRIWATGAGKLGFPGPIVTTITPTPSLYPNINLHPSNNILQTEESIATNPSNASMFLVGANVINPAAQRSFQGFYRTTNKGLNWSGSDTLEDLFPSGYSDPSVAYDLNGNAYFSFIRWQYYTYYLTVKKSTDGGLTWGSDRTIPWGLNPDKDHLTVDINPTSPFKNFFYLGWTDLTNFSAGDTVTPNPAWVVRDSAGTLYPPQNISGASGYYFAQGVNLAVAGNGTLYATWTDLPSYSGYYDDSVGFNKSTDGGKTWGTPARIPISGFSSIRGIYKKGPVSTNLIRWNSFPSMGIDRSSGPYSGTIYITWANASDQINHRKPDILLIKSTNAGASWSSPIRVNDDTAATQTDQWLPWIDIDPSGGVNVAFYDSRMDPTNNLMTQVYLARSTNGGATFKNYQISDTAFSPAGIPGTTLNSYMGDYLGVASSNEYILPCWNDSRSGNYQVFTARFGPLTQVDSLFSVGLNMASIPNVVSNFSKSVVYPTAIAPAYRYENGSYVATDPLYNGRGWWIRFDTATHAIPYSGLPIDSLSMAVSTNWNITGSISTTVLTSQLSSEPPGIVSTPFYKYQNGGYVATTTLTPGGGYWVKVSQNGVLKFKRYLPKVSTETDLLSSLDKFTVSDSYQGSQEFYVRHGGALKVEDGGDANVELPPDPPFDALNIRPKSGNFIQTVNLGQGVVQLPVDVKRALYPLTLQWDLHPMNGMTYWLVAEDSLQRISLAGSGSLSIQSLKSGTLILEASAGTPLVPGEYALNQNYPNPFNPQTTIRYELPETKHVRLLVYDVLGREVSTLVDERQDPGARSVTFDGTNLPSGVYFCRLQAGSFITVMKMLLMK